MGETPQFDLDIVIYPPTVYCPPLCLELQIIFLSKPPQFQSKPGSRCM